MILSFILSGYMLQVVFNNKKGGLKVEFRKRFIEMVFQLFNLSANYKAAVEIDLNYEGIATSHRPILLNICNFW